jgi:hypothetical protein
VEPAFTQHMQHSIQGSATHTGMETRQHKAMHSHAKLQIVTFFLDSFFEIYLGNIIKVVVKCYKLDAGFVYAM